MSVAKTIVQKWQCSRCGHVVSGEKPKLCEECRCPMLRDVTEDYLDNVDPKAVAHFKQKLDQCLRYTTDPATNQRRYHPLKRSYRFVDHINKLDPDARRSFVKVEEICATCGYTYGVNMIPTTRRDLLFPVKKEMEKAGIDVSWLTGPEPSRPSPIEADKR